MQRLLFALATLLLAGCATLPSGKADPRDPWERFNRTTFAFNDALDKAILKPTAQAYRAVLPAFVRTSVSNFFSNLNDVVVALNNLLQGKFTDAYTDFGRVAINSTLGVLGLFDIATEAGIERHQEDFGQTLGWWGLGPGPYLVIPILGPSDVRDAVGLGVHAYFDPVNNYVEPESAMWGVNVLRAVDTRAALLGTENLVAGAALDRYTFIRSAYLQRRRSLVYDGKPPKEEE